MPRKKGNGEGTIYPVKKNDKVIAWRGQQEIGGKRKSYYDKEKINVVNAMAKDRTDYSRGTYVATNETTVKEWVYCWLENEKKPHVKEQTYNKLKAAFDRHLIPALGNIKLQKLQKADIEKAYSTIFIKTPAKDDTQNPVYYSKSLITQLTSAFNSCLKCAVLNGYIIKNPHDTVKAPKGTPQQKIEAYTEDEQKKIIDYVKNSDNRAHWILYILISTGMRISEAIVLTWPDVDLNKKTISINKTLVYSAQGYIVQPEPKTRKSNRVISISNNVADFLKQVKKQTDTKENVRHYVLPNSKNNFFQPDYVRRHFGKICAILKIPYLNVHSLRHTWATRCLEKNIPIKVVSDMLGHENIQITLNIYQSVLRKPQEDVAALLNELF